MATPAEKKPAAPVAAAPAAKAAAPSKSGGGGGKLLVGLGIGAVLLVGVAVGWNVFRDKMEEKMKGMGGEERLTGDVPLGPPGQRRDGKSREIGGVPQEVHTVASVSNGVSDDEDLSAPAQKKKPKPVAVAAIPSNLPPAERAWRNLKADYDRLESNNDNTAKKYRMRVNVLEDKRGSLAEAAFVKEATTLDELIRADLAKPENQ